MNNFNTSVGNKIYHLRKKMGLSRARLGEIVGLHESTVKRYEDGDIKTLSVESLKAFAKALNADPGYLMGLHPAVHNSRKHEEPQLYSECYFIPVYGSISIYNDEINYEDEFDEIICPYPTATGALQALHVEGESMNKVIPHGVYAIFKLQSDFDNGQIHAVIIDNGPAILRRIYEVDEETIMLKPESTEDFQAITLIGDDIKRLTIVGKYIGHVTSYVD